MHPSSLPPRRHHSGFSQVGQVAGDLWLADAQDLHKIANANFPVGDEIEQAQSRAIGQGAEEMIEGQWATPASHQKSIYGLTDMCNGAYCNHIRISVYIFLLPEGS